MYRKIGAALFCALALGACASVDATDPAAVRAGVEIEERDGQAVRIGPATKIYPNEESASRAAGLAMAVMRLRAPVTGREAKLSMSVFASKHHIAKATALNGTPLDRPVLVNWDSDLAAGLVWHRFNLVLTGAQLQDGVEQGLTVTIAPNNGPPLTYTLPATYVRSFSQP